MKKMSESSRPFLGKVLAILAIAALVAAVVGCGIPDDVYRLTVTSTAGGEVTVPGEGSYDYTAGSIAELEAVAEVGHRFVEWTGDVGTVVDVDAPETTITIEGDYSITANFVAVYDLSISSTAGGTVTTPGEGTFMYDADSVVQLAAEALEGYRFLNWTGDVATIADVDAASTTIALEGDYSITANFVAQYVLTIDTTEGGEVTSPGKGTFVYDEGTVVNLVASPASGYAFARWTGDVGTIADVNAAATTITINGDYTVIADFEHEVVYFACGNLEAAVRDAIGKPTGDIYPSDLEGLTSLSAESRSIADLTGLEHCTNLYSLTLASNEIGDVSPLEGLTNLVLLTLRNNEISDVSALQGLTNLEALTLSNNEIGDISALQGLTNLFLLQISSNEIGDISALQGLTNLFILNLSNNEIGDISALQGLTNLSWLQLEGNQISDISPLVGLTSLIYLDLCGNQISDISPLVGLTGLIHLDLGGNQISDVSPLEGLTNLTFLYLYGNQISDISPLEGLTNLTELRLEWNQISDIKPLVDNEGLGEGDSVDLRWNPLSEQSINEYIPALQARGVTVDY